MKIASADATPSPPPPKPRSRLIVVAVILIIIGVAVFSEVLSFYFPEPTTPGPYIITVQIPNGAAGNRSVNFSPAKITLVVGVNNTVQWINLDRASHTVTFTSVPAITNTTTRAFSSPRIGYDIYFGPEILPSPGVYQYHDNASSWLTGTIVVKA